MDYLLEDTDLEKVVIRLEKIAKKYNIINLEFKIFPIKQAEVKNYGGENETWHLIQNEKGDIDKTILFRIYLTCIEKSQKEVRKKYFYKVEELIMKQYFTKEN